MLKFLFRAINAQKEKVYVRAKSMPGYVSFFIDETGEEIGRCIEDCEKWNDGRYEMVYDVWCNVLTPYPENED